MPDTAQLPIANSHLPFSRFLSIQASYGPSFSPDGQRLAFLSNITGVPQAWVMPAHGGWPNPLTFENERVGTVAWSPVEDALVFARDIGGNENAQLYWVRADGSGERRLTSDAGAMHIFGAWSPNGRHIAYAANRRDRGRYDIWLLEVASGAEWLAWHNDEPGFLDPVGFAPDGSRLLVALMRSAMDEDLYELALNQAGPAQVRHLTPQPGAVRFASPAYSADAGSVYCLCDLERDWRGVARINLEDLSLRWLATPAVEIDDLAVAPDGQRLVWAENHSGAHQLVALDLPTGAQHAAPGLPVGAVVASPADFDATRISLWEAGNAGIGKYFAA